MNEKIKEIENVLKENMLVALSKQCKGEFIIYTFYTNPRRQIVTKQIKEHFTDRELNNAGKRKMKRVEISIKKFLDDIVYDLLNRGYTLETYEDYDCWGNETTVLRL